MFADVCMRAGTRLADTTIIVEEDTSERMELMILLHDLIVARDISSILSQENKITIFTNTRPKLVEAGRSVTNAAAMR